MTFYNYLIQNRKSLRTAGTYNNYVDHYLDWMDDQGVKTHDYNNLLSYVDHCKSTGAAAVYTQRRISVLKQYFNYLKLNENPAQEIALKGITRKLPMSPLSEDQLKRLYESYDDKGLTGKRNKIMLGLMIYQGLGINTLKALEVEHVDLTNGTIYAPESKQSNNRTLDLQVFQLLSMQDYLLKTRPLILQEATDSNTSKLLVTRGTHTIGNPLHLMKPALKRILPTLQNANHLRTSRIHHWVKADGLRKAQYKSGHRYVSSTERYKSSYLEELKEKLNVHHPF
jgi:integrase/recombinase XerD